MARYAIKGKQCEKNVQYVPFCINTNINIEFLLLKYTYIQLKSLLWAYMFYLNFLKNNHNLL